MKIYKIIGVVLLAVGLLTSTLAVTAVASDPWDGYTCNTYSNHSGNVPDRYNSAFFYEHDYGWFGPIVVPSGGLSYPVPSEWNRSSWDKVKKCTSPPPTTTTTTTTTTTLPPTTTTTPPTTTTITVPPTTTTVTTVPPTTTTTTVPPTTTTVTSTTTTTLSPPSTTTTPSTTVPPTTVTTTVITTTTTLPELPRTGTNLTQAFILAIALLLAGTVLVNAKMQDNG